MAGVAHNPKFAAKVGIPQKVGKEFNAADAGKGMLNKTKMKSNKPAPMLGTMKKVPKYGD